MIQATATTEAIGVADFAAVITDKVQVRLYGQNDIMLAKADGVIAAGADVYPAASGLCTATVQGKRIGKALNTTATSGDTLQVIVMPPATDRVYVTLNIQPSPPDEHVWIADKAYTVVSIKEIHSVVGGSSMVADFRRISDTTAPGAAASATCVELLASALDLTTTINTSQTASLSAVAGALTVASGSKISANFGGTITGYVGTVVIELKAN